MGGITAFNLSPLPFAGITQTGSWGLPVHESYEKTGTLSLLGSPSAFLIKL